MVRAPAWEVTTYASNGEVGPYTIVNFDRQKQEVEMALSGNGPRGRVTGKSFSTTSYNRLHMTQGGNTMNFEFRKQ